MLSKGISFLALRYGGTSFGHWAGANSPGFAPDVTSYDYDAPINGLRAADTEILGTAQDDGEIQRRQASARCAESRSKHHHDTEIQTDGILPIMNGIDTTVTSHDILSMEDMDMGWGSMTYTTLLPEISSPCTMEINDPHDFAQVFVDGKYIGKIDRVK